MEKKPRQGNPTILPPYDIADASALQAVADGRAEPEQQRRAMRWIIEKASDMYGFHYHGAERDTTFALGRAFVGQQIVGLLKLSVATLMRRENDAS